MSQDTHRRQTFERVLLSRFRMNVRSRVADHHVGTCRKQPQALIHRLHVLIRGISRPPKRPAQTTSSTTTAGGTPPSKTRPQTAPTASANTNRSRYTASLPKAPSKTASPRCCEPNALSPTPYSQPGQKQHNSASSATPSWPTSSRYEGRRGTYSEQPAHPVVGRRRLTATCWKEPWPPKTASSSAGLSEVTRDGSIGSAGGCCLPRELTSDQM
jgi:hypothetical protein